MCFSCQATLFEAATFQRPKMLVKPDKVTHFANPALQINSHGQVQLVIKAIATGLVRVVCLSAPTGLASRHSL